jgi:hypothetical protein
MTNKENPRISTPYIVHSFMDTHRWSLHECKHHDLEIREYKSVKKYEHEAFKSKELGDHMEQPVRRITLASRSRGVRSSGKRRSCGRLELNRRGREATWGAPREEARKRKERKTMTLERTIYRIQIHFKPYLYYYNVAVLNLCQSLPSFPPKHL